jgi:hypothetical protein
LDSEIYAREEAKIFDVKELTGKIFRTKHLASQAYDARIGARATYLGGGDAQRARSDVTGRKFKANIEAGVRK